jgi:hypothetical protein
VDDDDLFLISTGITYSFKGLLLVLGLFLSYETRSLKVRHINDSRLVAMSIYNVAVLCLITTPVTMVISSQQDASFAFVALAIIFSSMITMGLVFVPKVIAVVREGNERSDRSSAPEGGTTKEDEERYHKLLGENETLQKLLQQKEERLKLLRQKLEEKNAGRRKVDIVGVADETHVKSSIGVSGGGSHKSSRKGGSAGGQQLMKADHHKMSSVGGAGAKSDGGGSSVKKNNVEHIEVLETFYNEPSESGIGQGLSVQTRTPTTTTDFELSESYL